MEKDQLPDGVSLYHLDETDEFYTAERCHILEMHNPLDDRSQSLARARVEPGVTTAWHRLIKTTEIYYILQGAGEIEIGEDFIKEVKVGDTIHIPADTAQRIRNTGDIDLKFLCFCRPAFGPDCYESLE